MVMIDNFGWGVAISPQSLPPDPAVVGEGWRETWLERLENHDHAAEWLQHQRRDAYWKQGSVCEDYGAIDRAVYAVGGWVDGYRNAVPRLLEELNCRAKGLVGPWGQGSRLRPRPCHRLPAGMHPLVGSLAEGHRDRDHGRAALSRLDARLCVAAPIELTAGPLGRQPGWPAARSRQGRSAEAAAAPACRRRRGRVDDPPPPGVGSRQPMVPLWRGPDCGRISVVTMGARSFRQRAAAGMARDPGRAGYGTGASADKPQAQLCVRLNDVAPDGASLRVTFGLRT